MVDASGHEKVWVNGNELKDLDATKDLRDERTSVVRYYTVTVEVDNFATGATDEAKAAALGHTYSGNVSASNSRFVLHSTAPSFNAETETTDWLTAETVSLTNIKVNYSSSTYSISSDKKTFYVVVNGEGATNNKDFSDTANVDISCDLSILSIS